MHLLEIWRRVLFWTSLALLINCFYHLLYLNVMCLLFWANKIWFDLIWSFTSIRAYAAHWKTRTYGEFQSNFCIPVHFLYSFREKHKKEVEVDDVRRTPPANDVQCHSKLGTKRYTLYPYWLAVSYRPIHAPWTRHTALLRNYRIRPTSSVADLQLINCISGHITTQG